MPASASATSEARTSRLVVDPEDGHIESILAADDAQGELTAAEPEPELEPLPEAGSETSECRAPAASALISWPRDGPRSWLVCFACFLVNAVAFGTMGTFPMLQLPLVELFLHRHVDVSSASAPVAAQLPAANSSQSDASDSANQWVVSRVSFIAGLNNGLSYLFCMAAPPLAERLGCRLVFLAGVVLSLVSCVGPAVWPTESIWVWWLFNGVAGGIGAALLYIIPALVLEQNFVHHFGLANGIFSLGSSLGYAVLPLVWQVLMDFGAELANAPADSLEAQRVGVSLTMYFCAALFALLLLLYPFFGSPFNIAASRHSRNKQKQEQAAEADTPSSSSLSQGRESRMPDESGKKLVSTVLSLLKLDVPMTGYKYGSDECHRRRHELSARDRRTFALRAQLTKYVRFWSAILDRNMIIFVLVGVLYTLGIGVPDQHSVMFAELKFPQQKQWAGSTLVAYGVAQGIARLLLGWLADVYGSTTGRAVLYAAGILVKGLATSLTPPALWLVPHFEVIVALNAVYGVGDGVQNTVDTALVQRLVGSERFGRALGLTVAASGIAMLISPSLGGLAFDLLRDYDLAFVISGTLISACSLLLFLIRPLRTSFKRRDTSAIPLQTADSPTS